MLSMNLASYPGSNYVGEEANVQALPNFRGTSIPFTAYTCDDLCQILETIIHDTLYTCMHSAKYLAVLNLRRNMVFPISHVQSYR